MKVIKFNSQLEHGQITVPKTLHLVEGQPVRVLILLDEVTDTKCSGQADAKSVWARTAGAWQGGNLVREPQGGYEQRLELK